MKKIYIVIADTYMQPYGSEVEVVGAYSTKKKAEARLKELKDKYFAQIEEVEIDKPCRLYVGGYIE